MLYLARYHAVAAYVTRRADSPDDCADMIAETFTTAWRRLDDIPPGGEARLWLYGGARRTLTNHFRAQVRRSALAVRLREELAARTRPVSGGDGGAAGRAFRRLSPGNRELLALVGWEGLDHAQIAKVARLLARRRTAAPAPRPQAAGQGAGRRRPGCGLVRLRTVSLAERKS
ncbi:RNA polymerase sigma factor [Nonomuraea jabiensis]|uniref:RNA polymerase sigma factor n=1 Tax=Nonomuraea jabiensis TaxID=882448 RepID=UPI003D760570